MSAQPVGPFQQASGSRMRRRAASGRNLLSGPRSLAVAALAGIALLLPGGLGAESSELRLPSGAVFHRTAQTVDTVRHVVVPESPLQVHLWQERSAAGDVRSFYAFSRQGEQLVGRVQRADYRLHIAGHGRDPLLTTAESTTGGTFEALRAAPDNRLFLVQMVATPLPDWRHGLEDLGGHVLRFVPEHTWLVDIEASRLADLEALPFVRWVGPYAPAYRLQADLRHRLSHGVDGRAVPGDPPGAARYSVMLTRRGPRPQERLRRLVEEVGGRVELADGTGLRIEATLTDAQLMAVVQSNDVQYIDRWGGPGEADLDVVRRVGGANYVENNFGWNGAGVRGEIFDTELRVDHQEWALPPLIHSAGTTHPNLHGSSCYSANFSQGLRASTRGLLPMGQGIFFRYSESSQFGGEISRYDINRQLIDPQGPYRAVFQTSSVGSEWTTEYTTLSAEVDDYLFHHPILSLQSQSNSGNRLSRPQAWAKNIVSVGGIHHGDSAKRCDDVWGGSASIGPASDGRIKPDLVYFNDAIHTAAGGATSSYVQFGGTSAATPVTAGHFGLLFQMWHEGVWPGHGGGDDVFASRPQMATAKALMINTAYRYDWTFNGHCTYDDVDRFKQGWGTSDLQRLLRRAPLTSVIDESDPLAPLEVRAYPVSVLPERKELNVTMVYTDPMGLAGAGQSRVNDLSLRVTDPEGTVYWGNYGLAEGNFSLPGGSSNRVDTVENVFIRRPMAGRWMVEVLADEVVQDSHLETPEVDADFALVVSGGVIAPCVAACGNGVVECGEVCDGTELASPTALQCTEEGCDTGFVVCNATCDGFDVHGGPLEPPGVP